MRTFGWLSPLCLVGAISLAPQATFTIQRGSVGPVSIGMSAQAITNAFPADRRRSIDLRLEGEPTPALELTLPGSKVRGGVVAELEGAKVYRIWIKDPAARTDKGIGVGSTVSDLRAAYPVAWVSNGEGSVYMRVEELGASFELDQGGPEGRELVRIRDPVAVPGSVKIIGVLLTTAG